MKSDDLPPLPSGRPRTPSLAWISNELLKETQELWSEKYGRPVTEDEAIEILVNVGRLAEVLLKARLELEARHVDIDTLHRDREEQMQAMAAREPWESVCNRKERARLKKMYGPEPRRRRRTSGKTPTQKVPPATDRPSD